MRKTFGSESGLYRQRYGVSEQKRDVFVHQGIFPVLCSAIEDAKLRETFSAAEELYRL